MKVEECQEKRKQIISIVFKVLFVSPESLKSSLF
jgi:hypothetical protein